jgi:hypothetical protein
MATNPFFQQYNYANESLLLEDLVIESIRMYGVDTYYVKRGEIREDRILNEHSNVTFDGAYQVEMYIKNVDGFQGDGDFLSKFGLQIRDQVTVTVARRSFKDHVEMKSDLTRPREGDLVYMPMNGKYFKVMFVEHESVFYQLGSLQVYDLRCELYEYSNEKFATGIAAIDSAFDKYSTNEIDNIFDLEQMDPSARNFTYEEESIKWTDFTERDPFSEEITFPKID